MPNPDPIPRFVPIAVALSLTLAPAPLDAAVTPTFVPQRLNEFYAPGNTDVTAAEFTPDGSRVIYRMRNSVFNAFSLHSVSVEPGSLPVRLRTPAGDDFDRQWSLLAPGGSHAIIQCGSLLYSVPLDGSTSVALGTPTRAIPGSSLALSPDGTSVAFFTREEDDPVNFERLAIVPASSGEAVLIDGGMWLGHWMRFSNDGATIYFTGAPPGVSGARDYLYAAPADGSSPAALLLPAEGHPEVPAEKSASPILLPDGSGLVYLTTSGTNFNFDIVRKLDLATGEATTLFASPISGRIAASLSDDASHALLYENFDSVHVVEIASAAVTTLATGLNTFTAILTPDSSSLIIRTSGDVSSHPLDGSPPTDLSDTAVVWTDVLNIVGITPDSSRVVFMANIDGRNPQLFSNTLDGANLVRLNQPIQLLAGIEFDARVSADGSHVLYRGDFVNEGDDYLFRVPVAGGTPQQLHPTGPPAGDVDFFLENPDGTGVAFIADLVTNSIDELFYHNYSTGQFNTLSKREIGDGRLSSFEISAGSDFVVYRAEQFTPGTAELISVMSTGGPVLRINSPPVTSGDVEFRFELSADGTRAVFLGDLDTNTVHELYSGHVKQGGPPTKLHPPLDGDRDVWEFALSPDGQNVAILGDLETNRRGELFVAAIDGSSFHKVSPELQNNNDIRSGFEFSPDGRWLAFAGPSGTPYAYHLPSGELRNIGNGEGGFFSQHGPSFSPDSKTLTFETFAGSPNRFIYRLDQSELIDLGPESTTASLHEFTSDSRFLAWADGGQLRVVEIATAEVMQPLARPLSSTLSTQFAIAPYTHRIVATIRFPSEIQIVNTTADGSDTKIVHRGSTDSSVRRYIKISASGRVVVFSENGQLYRADLTSDQPAVRINPGLEFFVRDQAFAVTPDGTVVYFIAQPEGSEGSPGLYRFDEDAEGAARVINIVEPGSGLTGVEAPIKLTPDARQLVFVSDHLVPGVRDLFATMPGIGIERLRPQNSDDDAIESTTVPGLTDITATEALLDDEHWTGLRFVVEGLNQDTPINRTRLSFTASADTAVTTRELLVRAQASPNAPPFLDGQAFDIINRPPVAASPIIWPLGEWTAGQSYLSPDLTPLLLQVIDQLGWEDPGPVVFTVLDRGDDTEAHRAWLSDGDPLLAPELQIDLVSSFAARLPLDAWANAFGLGFGPHDLGEDIDGDGLTLFAEYVFGLDPTQPNVAPSPTISFTPSENGAVLPTLQFTRLVGATEASITIESSSSLQTWLPIATSIAGAPTVATSSSVSAVNESEEPGGEVLVTLTLADSISVVEAQYFRFRVDRF